MTLAKSLSTACIASILLAGTAVAAPMAPVAGGLDSPVTAVALVMKGTRAGNAKQRHRTRLDRCRNVPSRC